MVPSLRSNSKSFSITNTRSDTKSFSITNTKSNSNSFSITNTKSNSKSINQNDKWNSYIDQKAFQYLQSYPNSITNSLLNNHNHNHNLNYTNLSSYSLTPDQHHILQLGLNFIPTPHYQTMYNEEEIKQKY